MPATPRIRNATVIGLLIATVAAMPIFFYQDQNKSKEQPAKMQDTTGTAGFTAVGGLSGLSRSASDPDHRPEQPEIPAEKQDIVVIGTELEGMYLARAAADEGLSVKILDPREAIGGQLLQGEMLFLDEPRDDQRHSLLQGRVKELFDAWKKGKIRKLSEFKEYFYHQLLRDLPVESGIRIKDIATKPGLHGEQAITSITYQTKTGQTKKIEADYFVDNTDFAALVGRLNTTRLPGLEKLYGLARPEFMGSGMMMKFKNVDWRKFADSFNSLPRSRINQLYGGGYVDDSFALGLSGVAASYRPTTDRVHLRGLNALYQRDGEVIVNALIVFDVDPSDDASIAEAIALGKKEIPLILDHLRRCLPGWENAELNGYPSYLYIREFYHYETDYVLQVSDVLGGRMFWDNVSIAGYPLDLQGVRAVKWGIEMGRPDKYGIPLSSFLLKHYENVIVAGKLVGASAIAYGSARIQANTSLAAESIGIILGQIHHRKKLKELTPEDMSALHQYLEKKYRIKLTGVESRNKIAGWTEDEIRRLNSGEIIYPAYVNKRMSATAAVNR